MLLAPLPTRPARRGRAPPPPGPGPRWPRRTHAQHHEPGSTRSDDPVRRRRQSRQPDAETPRPRPRSSRPPTPGMKRTASAVPRWRPPTTPARAPSPRAGSPPVPAGRRWPGTTSGRRRWHRSPGRRRWRPRTPGAGTASGPPAVRPAGVPPARRRPSSTRRRPRERRRRPRCRTPTGSHQRPSSEAQRGDEQHRPDDVDPAAGPGAEVREEQARGGGERESPRTAVTRYVVRHPVPVSRSTVQHTTESGAGADAGSPTHRWPPRGPGPGA